MAWRVEDISFHTVGREAEAFVQDDVRPVALEGQVDEGKHDLRGETACAHRTVRAAGGHFHVGRM